MLEKKKVFIFLILLENKNIHLNYFLPNIIKQNIKRNKKINIIIKIVIIQRLKIILQNKLILQDINKNN